jgi:indole-3-glycerol phosphate synthase
LEARAAGAVGVLVILRMLPRERVVELLDTAAEHGMFALLEAFDAIDLESARDLMASRASRRASRRADRDQILIGVNCRDLQTLQVAPQRFAALAPLLPADWPAVAESGVTSAADARRMLRFS